MDRLKIVVEAVHEVDRLEAELRVAQENVKKVEANLKDARENLTDIVLNESTVLSNSAPTVLPTRAEATKANQLFVLMQEHPDLDQATYAERIYGGRTSVEMKRINALFAYLKTRERVRPSVTAPSRWEIIEQPSNGSSAR